MRTPCFVEVLELYTSRETVFEYKEGRMCEKRAVVTSVITQSVLTR